MMDAKFTCMLSDAITASSETKIVGRDLRNMEWAMDNKWLVLKEPLGPVRFRLSQKIKVDRFGGAAVKTSTGLPVTFRFFVARPLTEQDLEV